MLLECPAPRDDRPEVAAEVVPTGLACPNPDAEALLPAPAPAIPVMPLYIALVYKVMKEKGLHEGTIEQLNRLFTEQLYRDDGQSFDLDDAGRFRMDDKELRDDVQAECKQLWAQVNNDNLFRLTDYAGYKHEFLKLFGFERPDVDYEAEVETLVDFTA